MFSRTPETGDSFGNEFGTGFGTSVAVGFFDQGSHEARDPWWDDAREYLAIGEPSWNGNGAVHL